MKYIKTNEKNIKEYWLLPTDSRLRKSLLDINCSDPDKFIDNDRIRYDYKYVFICHDVQVEYSKWGWNSYKDKLTDDFLTNNNFVFKGTINIIGNDPELEMSTSIYNL